MQSYQTTEDLAVIQATGVRIKSRIEKAINSIALLYEPGQDVTGPLGEFRETILEIARITPKGVWQMFDFIDHKISHERDRAIAKLESKKALVDHVLSGLTDVKPKRRYKRQRRTAFWHPEENRRSFTRITLTQEQVSQHWDKIKRTMENRVYRNLRIGAV